jgi:hypothetical protein
LEWGGFKADGHYYIETEEDLLQKFTTMEEFFVKLKTEQDMSDAQIDVAKETLKEQGIEYDQLMATGDLALTDIEMKEFGITQLD